MIISQVKLKGFRNFKNETINFNQKSLIMGANDVGKSNLLHALRILLDKSFSEVDIEPKDSDFYAYEETNELSILIKFEEVKEECVISKMKGYISDNDILYLKYKATRDPETNAKSYEFYAGHKENEMEELRERFYRRFLHLKYISSNRDLFSYISREKKYLLQEAKEKRVESEISQDNRKLNEIEGSLDQVNNQVTNLSFIKKATTSINEELEDLAFHHENQQIIFDVGASNVSHFVDNIKLSSKANGKSLTIGGDGRNNQIFLALWAAKNEIKESNPLEVVIYCIEEPEAHLHPHQQRKLARYLYNTLNGQVIITTHSPQITSEFSPNSIIRLYEDNLKTMAANKGCGRKINEAFEEFGHRMSIIPAEAFFADLVFLVEGKSEVIFYKTLAKELNIDLDRLNISILMVDGIGFKNYINILNALNIEWLVRTDNDIFKIKNKNRYRFAGIKRALGIYDDFCKQDEVIESLKEKEIELINCFKTKNPPDESVESATRFIDQLKKYEIFLAETDLENDLLVSEIKDEIMDFLETSDVTDALKKMQDKKATFMFDFLLRNSDCLSKLENNDIAKPLYCSKKIIKGELK
ncbi:putative ATP-dependent endonuclease of OLD family [Halanaerobium saccharolyticum]|jgi:putative ATP-dependent endonuclease of OLD family|uniref:Putative ATP-dependent endonuclease of OLD family n=1 Tax=Halanaerobium saccharolyticum TaxID=43595 RepID=A0A2T5RIX4_9FIRM|nr:AAA family ATPase [Halanaerobium saccharolyticum]PTV98371.1 putative ATP-dependent endonuclease of OLD family [Halanaerobium saccharolyticum]